MVGSHWKPSPCPMIILLKSITIPSLTPMVVLNQEKKTMVVFEPFIQWQWFLNFLFKRIFQGRAYFPIYWNIHSSSHIKNITRKESQNSFKWTQAPQRHQLSKCGPGCPEKEESAKEEVRPWVLDHQGNGDDEAADHHEMEVKSYDHDEDDSA